MAGMLVERCCVVMVAPVATGTAATSLIASAIPYKNAEKGSYTVSGTITAVTWYGALDPTNPVFCQAMDGGTSSAVQTCASSLLAPVPSMLNGAALIAAVGNAAGSMTVAVKS